MHTMKISHQETYHHQTGALDTDTRQLIKCVLGQCTGLLKPRWNESKALSTMSRVVGQLLEKNRYTYNGRYCVMTPTANTSQWQSHLTCLRYGRERYDQHTLCGWQRGWREVPQCSSPYHLSRRDRQLGPCCQPDIFWSCGVPVLERQGERQLCGGGGRGDISVPGHSPQGLASQT